MHIPAYGSPAVFNICRPYNKAMPIDDKLLKMLACPKCNGSLDYRAEKIKESLSCLKCKLRYRVEDGIPVMLIDEAEHIS